MNSRPSQECLDCTFSWFRGLDSFPLLPSAQEEEEEEEDEGLPESMKETTEEKEERKTDHDVARQDVVKVNMSAFYLFPLRFQILISKSVGCTQTLMGERAALQQCNGQLSKLHTLFLVQPSN